MRTPYQTVLSGTGYRRKTHLPSDNLRSSHNPRQWIFGILGSRTRPHRFSWLSQSFERANHRSTSRIAEWFVHPADRTNALRALVAPALLFAPFVSDFAAGYHWLYAIVIFHADRQQTNYLLHLHIHHPFSRNRRSTCLRSQHGQRQRHDGLELAHPASLRPPPRHRRPLSRRARLADGKISQACAPCRSRSSRCGTRSPRRSRSLFAERGFWPTSRADQLSLGVLRTMLLIGFVAALAAGSRGWSLTLSAAVVCRDALYYALRRLSQSLWLRGESRKPLRGCE